MSDSHISDDWWILLKDFTFPNHFSSDYLDSVATRLNQAKAGKSDVKSYMGEGDRDHYNKRKDERYNPNQKIKHKGFGKHSPEDVANIMANDLLHAHPELLEAMQSEIPAPDPKYGETSPSMQFHLFNTDDAVVDSKYGLINQFNPVFVAGKDGKVGLKTVFGRQSPASADRHTIRVTSSDSPAPSQSNTHIHEDLPSRFDFREAKPDLSRFEQIPIEERMPRPDPRHAELMSIYNLPPSFRPQVLQSKNIDAEEFNQWKIDNKLASEPMDLAWRMLKMPIISDSPEIKQLDSGPVHIHQFQDPVTGEVKPLYISPASNPDSENLYAGIVGDNGDRASAKFNTGGGDYASLDGIETQEPYRRRGYMSAIYDAMDEYLEQNKKGRRLVPSNFQSDEGKAFWESRKKSEPMGLAWRMLKAPLYQEESVGELADEPQHSWPQLMQPSTAFQRNPEYSHMFEAPDKASRAGLVYLGGNNYAIDTYSVLRGKRGEGMGRQGLMQLKRELEELHGGEVNLIPKDIIEESVPFWQQMSDESLVSLDEATYLP